MTDTDKIEARFWKSLRSDMTMMLGVEGIAEGHARPMTAQIDGDEDRGPIWFFGSTESRFVADLAQPGRAVAQFVSKDHEVFATIHGKVSRDDDRAVIDRLWNSFTAAWFEGGKDDPKLALIRLDPEYAQVWIDGSSLLAGVKVMLGRDPKKDYQDKVATVSLS